MVRLGRRRGLDIPQITEDIDEIMRLIPQERIQQRTVEQRVVVLVLRVVKEMVKRDQITPGMYGVDVSVATQSQVPIIRTIQKIVESLCCMVTKVICSTKVLLQLQSLI